MLQRYKLRLGDGTVLVVDRDGLTPWQEDREATVQTEGSRHWKPLREVLARERAAARRQLHRSPVHESPPPRRPSPPRQDSHASTGRADGLPLIPPPPKKATATPPPREDGLPLTPPPPKKAAATPAPREDGLPLVPPPPRRDALAEAPAPRDEGLLSIPAAPEGADEVDVDLPAFDANPVIVDGPAPDRTAETPPVVHVAGEIVPASLPAEPLPDEGPPVLFEPASLLASDPAPALAPGPVAADEAEVEVVVETAAEAAVFHQAEPSPEAESGLPPTIVVGAPRSVPAEPDGGETLAEVADAAFGSPEGVSAVAEEPGSRDADDRRAIDALPVIPFKAEAPVPAAASIPTSRPTTQPAAKPRKEPGARDLRPSRPPAGWAEPEAEAPGWVEDSRVQVVLRGAAGLGEMLSRGLAPLNRLERGEPAIEVEEGAFSRARARAGARFEATKARLSEVTQAWGSRLRETLAKRTADEEGPVPTLSSPAALAPVVEQPRPIPSEVRPAPESPPAVHEVRPATRELRPASPPAWAREPVAPVSRVREPAAPVARPKEPAGEPTPAVERYVPIADLPVVPLADAVGPEDWQEEDVYEGPGAGELLGRVWQWTVRVALIAAVVVGVAFAAISWRTWFPQAAQVGEATFQEIDRHARASERAAQQQRVLAEAAERLPYLSPETVRLILSRSLTGVLEIPDIFEAACDAADWGSWALTEGEAEELRRLRQELLATLGPIDQSRVLEYEHARASGLVFPLDNRLGVLLWARGARGLAPDDQERLRGLLAKAVAAGLGPDRRTASRFTLQP